MGNYSNKIFLNYPLIFCYKWPKDQGKTPKIWYYLVPFPESYINLTEYKLRLKQCYVTNKKKQPNNYVQTIIKFNFLIESCCVVYSVLWLCNVE